MFRAGHYRRIGIPSDDLNGLPNEVVHPLRRWKLVQHRAVAADELLLDLRDWRPCCNRHGIVDQRALGSAQSNQGKYVVEARPERADGIGVIYPRPNMLQHSFRHASKSGELTHRNPGAQPYSVAVVRDGFRESAQRGVEQSQRFQDCDFQGCRHEPSPSDLFEPMTHSDLLRLSIRSPGLQHSNIAPSGCCAQVCAAAALG